MKSILYLDNKINPNCFLFNNKTKVKYSNSVRSQKIKSSPYFGVELKNIIYKPLLKKTELYEVDTNKLKQNTNLDKEKELKLRLLTNDSNLDKKIKLLSYHKMINENLMIPEINRNYRRNCLSNNYFKYNTLSLPFPYAKPCLVNSFSKAILYKQIKDDFIYKSIQTEKANKNRNIQRMFKTLNSEYFQKFKGNNFNFH